MNIECFMLVERNNIKHSTLLFFRQIEAEPQATGGGYVDGDSSSMEEDGVLDDGLAIVTQLLAQTGEVDVHGAVEHVGLVFPYLVEDVLAREDPVGVAQQQTENLELLLGERHLLDRC